MDEPAGKIEPDGPRFLDQIQARTRADLNRPGRRLVHDADVA